LESSSYRSIAILGTRGIPARYGGFETFAEELSVRLAKQALHVTVYCLREQNLQPGYPKQDIYKNVRLIHIKSPKIGPLTTIMFDLFCLWHARKLYDIVYMLGYGSSLFCFIPRLWGSQVWVNMDGIEWKRSKWPWYGRWYLKLSERLAITFSDQLIADASEIKSYLVSKYGEAINCSIIPYGAEIVDQPPLSKQIIELKLFPMDYYLVVCRLEPENHVREILHGFIQSDTQKKLVVVGDKNMNTLYVKDLLKSNDRRVQFIGPVYDKGLLEALRFYAAGYFHGHSVGGTNPSLLEAMGSGNIVIAHDNIFNREVTGDVAFFFNGSVDIPGIISTVESLSMEKKKELSEAVRSRIREKYNWALIAGKYMSSLRR
jgi:glycosyltransferase involved in cell wall biosynthesis